MSSQEQPNQNPNEPSKPIQQSGAREKIQRGRRRRARPEGTLVLPDKTKIDLSKVAHGQVLYRSRLAIIALIDSRTGTLSFGVRGSLPVPTKDNNGSTHTVVQSGQDPQVPQNNNGATRDEKIKVLPVRLQKPAFEEALTELQRLELAALGLEIERSLKPTSLEAPWLRAFEQAHEKLSAFEKEGTAIVDKAVEFYFDHHRPGRKDITLQGLVEALIEAKGTPNAGGKRKRSRRTVAGWRNGVNQITRLFGKPTGRVSPFGKPIYDMPAHELTKDQIQSLDKRYGYKTARIYQANISAVLQYGVENGYLDTNWARKVRFEPDVEEGPAGDISILTNVQVQNAYNLAARLHGGTPLPIVVLKIHGALRPDAEIPFFSWDKVDWDNKSVTVFSSKTGRTRTVELCVVAMAILRWCYDRGIQPYCSNSDWAAIKMIMGYFDRDCRLGLWPEGYEEYDLMPHDVCRHDGNSNRHRYDPNIAEGARWSGDTVDVYIRHYVNGRITKPMSAQFHVIAPDLMPTSPDLLKRIREELIEHNLIGPKDLLPERPVVPTIHLQCRELQPLPTISDLELGTRIWDTNVERTAREQKMSKGFLTGYCRAKRIALPPKNNHLLRKKFKDAPVPPPYVTISHEELQKLIWEHMGVRPVARKLGLNSYWLLVYCRVHQIDVPSRRAVAKHWRNAWTPFQAPVNEVKDLLSQTNDYRTVAKHYGILDNRLVRYCKRHGLRIPGYVDRRRPGGCAHRIKITPAPGQPTVISTGVAKAESRKLQVTRLLQQLDSRKAARQLGMRHAQLVKYCRQNDIPLPGESSSGGARRAA